MRRAGWIPTSCMVLTATFLADFLVPAPLSAAAGKDTTRDLVYEEDEPQAPAATTPDRDIGPGPFYSFNKKQLDIVEKGISEAYELRDKGQNARAQTVLDQLDDQFRQLPRPPDPKINLLLQTQRAHTLSLLDRHTEAEKLNRKAVALAEKAYGPNSDEVLQAKANLAVTLSKLGRDKESVQIEDAVFRAQVKKYGPTDERTLNTGVNLVSTLGELNRYDEALGLGEALLGVVRQKYKPDVRLFLRLRYTMAQTLGEAGDFERAETTARHLIDDLRKLKRTGDDLYPNAIALLADILNRGPKKDNAQAARLLDEARRSLVQIVGHDNSSTYYAQLNLVHSLIGLKDYAAAERELSDLQPRLARSLDEAHPLSIRARLELGNLRLAQGDSGGAVAILQEILPAAQESADQQLPLQVAASVSKAHRAKGDLETAAFFGIRAVEIGQRLRRQLHDAPPSLQKALAGRMTDVYQSLADVFLAQGKPAEAQRVVGLLKDSELADMTIGAAPAKKPAPGESSRSRSAPSSAATAAPSADVLGGMDRKLADRYDQISSRIEALATEQRALLDKRSRGDSLSAPEEERLKALRDDMTTARKAFTALMKNLSSELGHGDKRSADLGASESYQRLLPTLGDGVVLLQTVVTESRTWLILTTPNSQIVKQSPLGTKALREKVASFRDVLQDADKDPRPLAKEFHDAIIGPIASALDQGNTKTIMFSLDDQLRYVPMAALYDGRSWLVQKYDVSLFNEATKAGLAVPAVGNWKVAGLGVTKEHKYGRGTFTALPAVKDELTAIVRTQANAKGALTGDVALDEAFTAEKLQEVLEQGYPVIHLASHFHFDQKNPEASFLLLGDGTGLPLTKIESEDFKFKNVDLLALSACQTARGGVDATGKEIEGFGALAQKRGAKAVLATLWPVFDESTGLLMSNFYRLHGGKDRTSIAAALRRAQLLMIENKIDGKDFRHPFYWGPFVLMGDWR